MKSDSTLFALVLSTLTAAMLVFGAPLVESGQSEPVETVLQETAGRIDVNGPRIRCGKYFVLESREYSGYEVKQVHVVLPLSSTNVALVGLYYQDIETVLDESKETPVLLRMKDASGRETDIVRLSKAELDEAQECLPPPGEK